MFMGLGLRVSGFMGLWVYRSVGPWVSGVIPF